MLYRLINFIQEDTVCFISGAVSWLGIGLFIQDQLLHEALKLFILILGAFIGGFLGYLGKLLATKLFEKKKK